MIADQCNHILLNYTNLFLENGNADAVKVEGGNVLFIQHAVILAVEVDMRALRVVAFYKVVADTVSLSDMCGTAVGKLGAYPDLALLCQRAQKYSLYEQRRLASVPEFVVAGTTCRP